MTIRPVFLLVASLILIQLSCRKIDNPVTGSNQNQNFAQPKFTLKFIKISQTSVDVKISRIKSGDRKLLGLRFEYWDSSNKVVPILVNIDQFSNDSTTQLLVSNLSPKTNYVCRLLAITDLDTVNCVTEYFITFDTLSWFYLDQVAWYPFNGNAKDLSVNKYDGTPINGALLTSDRFGTANSAFSFDGIDDRILINEIYFDPSWHEFTISGWCFLNTISNMNNVNGSHTFLNTSPHHGLSLAMNWGESGRYSFWLGNGSPASSWNVVNNSNSNQNIEVGKWKLITFVKIAKTYSLYVDGVLASTFVGTGLMQSYYYKLYLGGTDPLVTNEVINGKIDDVGIWNRAFTQDDITKLYNYRP